MPCSRRWLKTGESDEFEGRIRNAAGMYQWFLVQRAPLLDAEGRIVLWLFMQTTIDERKRAEAVLALEKRLLEMVALGRPLLKVLNELCRLADVIAENC